MKKYSLFFILLFGAPAFAANAQALQSPSEEALAESELVAHALEEIDLSLDAYFQLIDEEDLLLFVTAVNHAARGRLLLEQYLGEDMDNVSTELLQEDYLRFELAAIARHAKQFSGEEAREMWRRDHAYDHFENAKMKLAEWDVRVKAIRGHLLNVEK